MTVVQTPTTQILTVEQPDAQVLTVGESTTHVLTASDQGAPGPRGLQGPPGGATLVRVGATPLSGHTAAALDADGTLVAADCTLPPHCGAVLGVVTQAWNAGEDAQVQAAFPLVHAGWTWVPGPVFVGTAGQLTQALPDGAVFAQVIGLAVSETCVLIDPQPPVLLV